MTENEIQKRQREILRRFRRINNERDEVETEANEVLDNSKKHADSLLNQIKESINIQTREYEKKMHELSYIKKSRDFLILAVFIYSLNLFPLFPSSYSYFYVIQIVSSVMLCLATSTWNMGSAVPEEKGRWDYFWSFIVPFLPLALAIYYLLSSYPNGLNAISGRYPNALDYETANTKIQEEKNNHHHSLRQAELRYQKTITDAHSSYNSIIPEIKGASNAITIKSYPMSASWIDERWKSWIPPVQKNRIYALVRIGSIIEKGKWDYLTMPAFLQVIGGRNIVIKASGEGKEIGVGVVRSIILRLLTSVPPGKLRFILIDPVGSGQNVAAFLRLADYDEALTGNKIWTEPRYIEERLTNITEQMELIIQKLLRERYSTIEEYNATAEEVAEPYRVLVVLNFPVNFTISSARLLDSIARNGPRCGIYTIITVDTEKLRTIQW